MADINFVWRLLVCVLFGLEFLGCSCPAHIEVPLLSLHFDFPDLCPGIVECVRRIYEIPYENSTQMLAVTWVLRLDFFGTLEVV